MRNPLELPLLCLASGALAMPIDRQSLGQSPGSKTTTLLSFFTDAPEYMASALKDPQTIWSSSRVLPIFWTDSSSSSGDAGHGSSSICRHRVGSWVCGLLAGVSLLAIVLAGFTLVVLVVICAYKKVCLA